MNKKMNFSHLSEAETYFLSVIFENKLNGSDDPTYGYTQAWFSASVKAMITSAAETDGITVDELKFLMMELYYLEKYLLKGKEKIHFEGDLLKIAENYSSEEITDHLLHANSITFIVKMLKQWRKEVEILVTMLEKGVSGMGAANDTIN